MQFFLYSLCLFLHLTCASIWTGGHLILSVLFVPHAWKKQQYESLLSFENLYEKIGIPALFIQIGTGIYLAQIRIPFHSWFLFPPPDQAHWLLLGKLILLGLTFLLAIHMKTRILPNLTSRTFPLVALHVFGVTFLSLLFVLFGLFFRLPLN